MEQTEHTRRRFVTGLAGTALTIGVAGCTSAGQSGDGSDSNDTAESGGGEEADHEGDEEGSHDDEAGDHDDGEGDHDAGEDDDGHNHDGGAPEEPSPSAQVTLRTEGDEHHFDPHLVWIEPGGTVTWEADSGHHDAVAYHPDNGDKPLRMPEGADPWETGLLGPDDSAVSHTFETEGVYDYFCTPHESVGMVGTVVVGQPDAHDQPALEAPQDSLPDGARAELGDLGDQVNELLGHTH
jgi:plastocyanin